VDFGRTTLECELELHQAHSVAMLRRASRRNIDIWGGVQALRRERPNANKRSVDVGRTTM
jgi:hypothetical protein